VYIHAIYILYCTYNIQYITIYIQYIYTVYNIYIYILYIYTLQYIYCIYIYIYIQYSIQYIQYIYIYIQYTVHYVHIQYNIYGCMDVLADTHRSIRCEHACARRTNTAAPPETGC
jgi:hypothetical protein